MRSHVQRASQRKSPRGPLPSRVHLAFSPDLIMELGPVPYRKSGYFPSHQKLPCRCGIRCLCTLSSVELLTVLTLLRSSYRDSGTRMRDALSGRCFVVFPLSVNGTRGGIL